MKPAKDECVRLATRRTKEQLAVMRPFSARYHYRAGSQAKSKFLITNGRFCFSKIRSEWQLSIPAGDGNGSGVLFR